MESRDKRGVTSNSLALTKRERESHVENNSSNLLEKILSRDNMIKAYKRVIANKGSHGVDRMRVDEPRPFLIDNWLNIKQKLLEDKYNPSLGAY